MDKWDKVVLKEGSNGKRWSLKNGQVGQSGLQKMDKWDKVVLKEWTSGTKWY